MHDQLVMDPASTSTTLPQPLPELQRRPYDEESRVSTDSDLDLTDFDDEDGDRDDVYNDDEMRGDQNRSTFSGVLMRRLRILEEQQQRPLITTDDDVDRPGELIRPPLLAIADDSFSAKMRRVLKWTHSLPPSDAVSESSGSSLCSPATVPTAILSIPAPGTQSRKRRLSDALFPDDGDIDATQHHHHQHHHHQQHHYSHVLKRPRISGVFSPSVPGSPFFSTAPRLYPFPISAPSAPAPAPAVAVADQDHDHKSRSTRTNTRTSTSSVLRPCDYSSHNHSQPIASSHANNYNNSNNANAYYNNNAKVTADGDATGVITTAITVAGTVPNSSVPIGTVRLDVKNVVDLSRLQFLPSPSARIGMTLSDNNNGVHICTTARDASSQGFIRHCPPAISYAA